MAVIVRLNVGGAHFDVLESTLRTSPFFATLLDNRLPRVVDSDGRIFVDRDGGLFRCVLQHMRTGSTFSEHDGYGEDDVRGELEYYLMYDRIGVPCTCRVTQKTINELAQSTGADRDAFRRDSSQLYRTSTSTCASIEHVCLCFNALAMHCCRARRYHVCLCTCVNLGPQRCRAARHLASFKLDAAVLDAALNGEPSDADYEAAH